MNTLTVGDTYFEFARHRINQKYLGKIYLLIWHTYEDGRTICKRHYHGLTDEEFIYIVNYFKKDIYGS